MSRQVLPRSPPRLPAARRSAAAAAPASRAVRHAVASSADGAAQQGFATPKRRNIRSSFACSPTSVVGAFDRHQARWAPSGHHPKTPPRCVVAGGGLPLGAAIICQVVAPSPNRKYKTEMCKNMLEYGCCRFGDQCHYAHSEAERHSTSVEDLIKEDKLLLPCCISVSTGYCPYGHRCKNLHDPNVMADDDGKAIVLEHCVKDKKGGFTIPDRLYHHRMNSARQTNPLVAPHVWENCRPSCSIDESSEWIDTYHLVCNATGPGSTNNNNNAAHPPPARKRRTGGGPPRYSDVVSKSSQRVALGELQRLCIVIHMRATNDAHLDFTYAPTDCVNDQPCMVLQTRHFRLLDFATLRQKKRVISLGEVVTEVSPEACRAGKSSGGHEAFVSAHEVAFDSKGKRACNLSIWFDVNITPCSTTKAKKVSKMTDPWRLDDKTSLFCMPNNEEFERAFPVGDRAPYVFMQPVDDLGAGHDLVGSILRHRAAAVLQSRGFGLREHTEPLDRTKVDFACMKKDVERWAWPKTSAVDHLSKTTETRNQAEYRPEVSDGPEKNATSAIWESFVTNLHACERGYSAEAVPEKRLPVFRSIAERADDPSSIDYAILPRIGRFLSNSSEAFSRASCPEATWRELLLGEGGGDGPWRKAIECHVANPKRNPARSSLTCRISSYPC